MITFGALLPHPPIIVPGVGSPKDLEQVKETTAAMQEVDRILAEEPPETLVVFTPHGTVYTDAIIIYNDQILTGGLGRFGLDRTWSWETDREMVEKLSDIGSEDGLPIFAMKQSDAAQGHFQEGLDHGVLVPLSFFDSNWASRVKLVVIPLSYLPLEELYRFGAVVQNAATELNRRVAVIASGDLSHCLKPGAPAPYDPRGEEFDHKIIKLIKEGAVTGFFEMDRVLLEKAAECGFRSLIMLLGAMDGREYGSIVHSYQGPFGVGYLVASFRPSGNRRSMVKDLYDARDAALRLRRERESLIVKYARQVVEGYLNQKEIVEEPEGLNGFFKERAGVFVSIKKHGQLRGCIGTTAPTQPNVVAEVKQNAISASTGDPRFEQVTVDELNDLVYSVDILGAAVPISGIDELDPERYGVIVRSGYRSGLLLPNLEGIETAAEQVAIARKKAGIGPDEPVKMERFEVIRYL